MFLQLRMLSGLLMPIIIIGGIMSGVFTPTESAAIAVLYSAVIGLTIFDLKVKDIWPILVDSAKATGQVLLVVAFASLFTWVITVNNIPQTVIAYLASAIDSKIVFLLVVNVL